MVYKLRLGPPPEPLVGHLRMSEPEGQPDRIVATSTHLLRGGRPWFPVMGEMHFTRYPRADWREQLLSMRAGGVGVVATYLFWHHHEERQGEFRFEGNRDVRAFVESAAACGLDAVVRIGPWAHGEARYGGFPEWVQHSGTRTRTDDPAYLDLVRPYYTRISAELDGLYHAQGGPIVAVQIENELYDQPEHLRTLKRMAREAGITPALWTATAWGGADLPADEFLPVYAGYPEAPWDDAHPGWARHNRRHFFFTALRDDHTVGADLRRRPSADKGPALDRYPYATCELGGGIQVTYHRRPLVPPEDVAALALAKIGSGSAWQGYYMYQGGSHVTDAATTMQESTDTGYPNDLPVISYDFQAPLGEYGQVRPSYELLRLQHHLLAAAGERLAPMGLVEPAEGPRDLDDRETLRWAARTDGISGMVFVNTHQPGGEILAAHSAVRFRLDGPDGPLELPVEPVDIPSGAYFAWPFRWPLPGAATLESATAQLVAVLDDLVVLTRTAGIPVELVLTGVDPASVEGPGVIVDDLGADRTRVRVPHPGTDALIRLDGLRLLVLDEHTARHTTVGELWGTRRLLVGDGIHVVPDGRHLHIESGPAGGTLFVHPAPTGTVAPRDPVTSRLRLRATGESGIFARFAVDAPTAVPEAALVELAAAKGPAPQRIGGPLKRAAAPTDDDYALAAAHRVEFGHEAFTAAHRLLLRLDWVGDVARAEIGGTPVADQYWNGAPWEIDLTRHRAALEDGAELVLRLLPFDPAAKIHVPDHLRPDEVTLRLREARLVPVYRAAVGIGAP
ncbi:beta-galactosidase [Streptomyces johnsoniae]|uniref:Beta-galactosidase n=1 Tax=Streptomyces johnsoniae TaxID=3075532 RepID=A0ABU2SFG1_9ACTN|nr:beta-galactosidase [Streptomyces sp. DSM 41886]MDT0447139.1 beta-galactosidase [Streptomyces sp. DSM 41886]